MSAKKKDVMAGITRTSLSHRFFLVERGKVYVKANWKKKAAAKELLVYIRELKKATLSGLRASIYPT